ncbi:hypothetical protein GCM10027589_04370 [Actinocorallia lasiicapitis]
MTTMILFGLAPVTVLALIMGVAIGVDRYRAHHRDPRRGIVAVVDRRTYRDAARAADQLIALGEIVKAHHTIIGIELWLRGEIQIGPRRRRIEYAAALEQWQLKDEPLRLQLGLPLDR